MKDVQRYVDAKTIASWFNVQRATISQWLRRHGDDPDNPFPAPDITIGGVHGWLADREPEIREWDRRRKGQAWRAGVSGSREVVKGWYNDLSNEDRQP